MQSTHIVRKIVLVLVLLAFSAAGAQAQTPVNIRAVGDTSIGNALPVTLTPSGLAAYTGTGSTVTAIATTAATVVTANTMTVNSLYIGNATSSAATVTIADNTSGTALYTTFSIPANSVLQAIAPGANLALQGLKLTAGTANALNYIVSGWTKTGT